ncbi:hypothetical protein [Rhodoferax sp. GW822-FHT02A01]|uniref:hypothetical protein n=1 Tax=Rhodoferax sp. GW822-FHT02A01 TaxID=3141537 RepID=UPI00315C6401
MTILLMVCMSSVAVADPQSPGTLSGALSGITDVLATYLAALAGASGLAVAFLEAFKKLFSVRGRFNRAAVILWLSEDDASVPKELRPATTGPLTWASLAVSLGRAPHYSVRKDKKADSEGIARRAESALRARFPNADRALDRHPYDPARAYAEFFHLTSGQRLPIPLKPRGDWAHWRGIDRAVFELDVARLMAQVQDAADAVLSNPSAYRNLYAFFTRGCSAEEAGDWQAFVTGTRFDTTDAPTKAASDLYGRVRLLMRRQLDAFQCVTASRWEEMNQLWAILVGAVILLLAQFIMLSHLGDAKVAPFLPIQDLFNGAAEALRKPDLFFGVVLKAALGGALAPFAKDLLSSISSLKFTKP